MEAQESENRALLEEWQEVVGHPLTSEEYLEIQENLSAFFELLIKWELPSRKEINTSSQKTVSEGDA